MAPHLLLLLVLGATPFGTRAMPAFQVGVPGALTTSESLRKRARKHVFATEYDLAEADYRRLLERDGEDGESGAGLALALARQNRLSEAEKLARDLCTRTPASFEARLVLAEVLLRTGRAEEAIAEYEAAASVGRGDPRAPLGRARALFLSGRETEARAADARTADWLRELIRAQPEDAELRLALARALARSDRTEEALAECEEALRLLPAEVEPRIERARILLRMGLAGEARDEADRALEEDPRCAEAYGLRGQISLRLGQAESAEADYRCAAELDRWCSEYPIGVARARLARGDAAGASASCAEARSRDPESAEVADLELQLGREPVRKSFRLDTGLRYDRLSGNREDWWQETVHLAWRANEAWTFGAGVDVYRRFGEDDGQVSADATWRFRDPWAWSVAVFGGPDAEVVARAGVDTELSRRLGRGATAYLRYRHSEYAGDDRVDLVSPGIEVALGPRASLLARYYHVEDSEAGPGNSGSLKFTHDPEGKVSESVGIGYGSETFLVNAPNAATRASDVLTLAASVAWQVSEGVRLRVDYDYEDHTSTFEKHGISVGLSFDF